MFKPLKKPKTQLYTALLVTAVAVPVVLASPDVVFAKPAAGVVAKTDEVAADAKMAAAQAAQKAKSAQRAARRAELLENPPIAWDKLQRLVSTIQGMQQESVALKTKAREIRKGLGALFVAEKFDKAQFIRLNSEIDALNSQMRGNAVKAIAGVLETFTVEERKNLIKFGKSGLLKKALKNPKFREGLNQVAGQSAGQAAPQATQASQ